MIYLSRGNKKEVLIHAKHGRSLKIFCSVKKLVPKDHIIYDSIQMECPEEANLQKQSMNGYQGMGNHVQACGVMARESGVIKLI